MLVYENVVLIDVVGLVINFQRYEGAAVKPNILYCVAFQSSVLLSTIKDIINVIFVITNKISTL